MLAGKADHAGHMPTVVVDTGCVSTASAGDECNGILLIAAQSKQCTLMWFAHSAAKDPFRLQICVAGIVMHQRQPAAADGRGSGGSTSTHIWRVGVTPSLQEQHKEQKQQESRHRYTETVHICVV
jgi:hypothetical protein